MKSIVRIGTRDSQLALWQARHIQDLLLEVGLESTLVLINSQGEADLQTPLYEMGVQGIFTKTLDIALLENRIDIAVHSLKDVPTQIASGLEIAAIPQRGNPFDVLVYKEDEPSEKAFTIATSSLRRKAQWLHKYPNHSTEPIRGNINTRMQKLQNTAHLDGVLFAAAGLERIQLIGPNMQHLDWMIPAPGQGALAVVCRKSDEGLLRQCVNIDDRETRLCVEIERQYLRHLMGGCTMPIAGHAHVENDEVIFKGCLLSVDGKQKLEVSMVEQIDSAQNLGKKAAEHLLDNGGREIIKTFAKL